MIGLNLDNLARFVQCCYVLLIWWIWFAVRIVLLCFVHSHEILIVVMVPSPMFKWLKIQQWGLQFSLAKHLRLVENNWSPEGGRGTMIWWLLYTWWRDTSSWITNGLPQSIVILLAFAILWIEIIEFIQGWKTNSSQTTHSDSKRFFENYWI